MSTPRTELDKSAIWMVPQPFDEAFLDFALDEKDRLGQVYVEILTKQPTGESIGRIVCLDNVMLEAWDERN